MGEDPRTPLLSTNLSTVRNFKKAQAMPLTPTTTHLLPNLGFKKKTLDVNQQNLSAFLIIFLIWRKWRPTMHRSIACYNPLNLFILAIDYSKNFTTS